MGIKFLCLVLLLSGSACQLPGQLFSWTTRPHMTNYKGTPVCSKKCVLSAYRFKEPISGYGLSAEWDWAALNTAAAEEGIETIHYTDRRLVSILFGTYVVDEIIVYGE